MSTLSFLRGLNQAQLEVATHRGSPLLVFAAAGTGKTQALASRIAHIVAHDGVPPEKILALTFTRKAAAEMRERAAGLCGIEEGRLRSVGTFHSLCVNLLRRYGFYKSKSRNRNRLSAKFTILEPEQMDAIMEEQMWDGDCFETALHDHNGDPKHRHHSSNKRQKDIEDATKIPIVRKRIDAWRNRGLDPDDAQVVLESTESLVSRVAYEVYSAYREVCARRNVVDFGDLLLHACTTLERVPGALEDCRTNAYAHLLVDEFQDTNEAQMRLVRILCASGTSAPKDDGLSIDGLSIDELMVVGDDYQAIHEWRGSNVRNILEFTSEFPTARTICLSLNYRSAPSILEAARNVIARNANQKHKELVATREGSGSVSAVEFESPQDEAEKIADEIHREWSEGRKQPKDFAILYRSNAHSQPLEAALGARGVPYRLRGGARSFFQRAEIKDVMAYARLLVNPRSDHDFERAIHVPHRGVGDKTIELLRQRVEDPSHPESSCLLEAAMEQSGKWNGTGNGHADQIASDVLKEFKGKRIEAVASFVRCFSSLGAFGSAEIPTASLRALLESTGYLAMIKETSSSSSSTGLDRYQNVSALLNLAEKDPDRSLREFVDACSLLDSSTSLEEDQNENENENRDGDESCKSNRVSLMTMHASKGLEFDVVYVAGFAEGSLPHSLSVLEGNIEEERRLCYVAITRARDKLVLCVPKARMRFGKSEATPASRFLAETK